MFSWWAYIYIQFHLSGNKKKRKTEEKMNNSKGSSHIFELPTTHKQNSSSLRITISGYMITSGEARKVSKLAPRKRVQSCPHIG